MNEINMTPFVDIMLVLLIIFIVTVPVMRHAVTVDLPRASNQPLLAPPQTIRLAVDAQGQYFWDDAAIGETELEQRLSQAATQLPQPELHISGDKAVRYERVALAMAMVQRAGLRTIGFVTEPASP
ncbi:MAG: biopolymer transporter ExbD, partial [Rhodoferax sp.]|nr:biopolymer transporter ExbD [Rhodoferax sp.]